MSKFRQKTVGTKTENLAGGEAYKESPKLELISLLLTSFVSDKFYESASEQLERLSGLVKSISDKKFIAKSAIYARNVFGMRSITHAVIGELVKTVKGEDWVKNAVDKTVKRPDDMLEMLAYVKQDKDTPIPNSLKKGLSLAVGKFDAYQLAKYRGEKSNVKMVDLFNLIHPKARNKDEQELFAKLVKGELKSKDTWETKLTQAGQKAKESENSEEVLKEEKAKAWHDLIKEKKLGYFALLRNLRNIIEQAPEILPQALEMLKDEKMIKKSLVLPFRFTTALQEMEKITNSREVIVALNEAIEVSLSNVPKFDGKTLIALDESGSMSGKPIDIGSLFASVLYKTNDSDLMMFSSDARYKTLNPSDSLLTITQRIKEDIQYGGTNFNAIFENADKKYDRVIILSDMQGWINDSWSHSSPAKVAFPNYKKRVTADPFIYSFDLQGYGTLEFPENKIFCIAGWSEKIFEAMKLLEQDKNALINEIEKIEL